MAQSVFYIFIFLITLLLFYAFTLLLFYVFTLFSVWNAILNSLIYSFYNFFMKGVARYVVRMDYDKNYGFMSLDFNRSQKYIFSALRLIKINRSQ